MNLRSTANQRSQCRILLSAATLWLLAAMPAMANNWSPIDGPILIAPSILAEALIVMMLVAATGLNWLRVGYVWLAINIVSWLSMAFVIVAATQGGTGAVFVAELAVVALEASIMRMFINRDFFQRSFSVRLGYGSCLLICIIGNITSFVLPFFVLPLRPW